MKILMLTGLQVLEEKIEQDLQAKGHEAEVQIGESLYDLSKITEDTQAVIINRYLDESEDGHQLEQAVRKARNLCKNIQFVVLFAEKETEVIQTLVSVGVYDLVISANNEPLESLASRIVKSLELPARQFDFEILKEAVIEESVKNKEISQKDAKYQNDQIESKGFSLKLQRRVIIESVFKEVIAFYSPLNDGATTTVLNLGIALTESRKCKVLVMGLDLLNSSMGERLKKQPQMNLYKLVDAHKKRIPINEALEDAIVQVGSLGVLPGSFDFNEYYCLGEADLWELIKTLQKLYDYILIDTNAYLTDKVTIMTLLNVHRVYLVSSPSASHLAQAVAYQSYLKEKLPQCHLSGTIINRFNGESLTTIEIETLLGQKPIAIINEHKKLTDKCEGILTRKRILKAYKGLVKEVMR